MKNPLDSIQGTIIAGVVLLIASIVFLDWSEIGMSGLLGDAS